MITRTQEENINTVEYLDDLYSGNWRPGYDGALVRFRELVKILPQYQKVLDVGCAGGDFLKFYSEKYPDAELFGIDISSIVIEQAKQNKGTFAQMDIYNLIFENNYFDMIHCGEVIEHLEDPAKAISEMKRILKPGGDLILTTVNELAAPYEEHLWRWDIDGVKSLLKGFNIIQEEHSFGGAHTLLIICQKLE